ncbi:hypothetical protein SEA_ROMAN_14 [Microbacterium phage Roman]|nr:hypothetical protein LUPINE_13 [Microbacterium phage Lupine]QDK03256.1 hypothetical protein SEA_ROMAN_14 [Microbacterium phage Roman]
MDCPVCGEPDMIFYEGDYWYEDGIREQEPDAYSCPECGHMEVL